MGKSSVTTNLAVALAQRGHSVAVVDADVWGFSIPRMLGVDRPPVVIDEMLVPPESHGVRCISMGFFAEEDQPVIWRGPMLHKALEQFLTDVYWDEPDFLVIDLPPGTGDIALSLAQFLPRGEVYVVTTPQPAAQRVAQRAAFMAQKVHLEVKGIIENMSWFTGDDGTRYELFGAGGGQDLADRLEVPLLGQVPLVPALREGGDAGRPIVVERARQRGRRGLRRHRRAHRRRAGPHPGVQPRAQAHLTRTLPPRPFGVDSRRRGRESSPRRDGCGRGSSAYDDATSPIRRPARRQPRPPCRPPGGSVVDVRIGVTNTVKEIDIELPADADRDKVKKSIDTALADETQVLWLTDKSGKRHRRAVGQDRLHRAGGRRRGAPNRVRCGLAPWRRTPSPSSR